VSRISSKIIENRDVPPERAVRYGRTGHHHMNPVLYFDRRAYVVAADAAVEANLTRDYISLLCRRRLIVGRRVGRNWYVDHAAFRSFLVSKEYQTTKHRNELSGRRMHEYKQERTALGPRMKGVQALLKNTLFQHAPGATRAVAKLAGAPAGVAEAALRTAGQSLGHIPLYAVTPLGEFAQKLTALTTALVLVFGTFSIFQPRYARFAAQSLSGVATSITDLYANIVQFDGNQALESSAEAVYSKDEALWAAAATISAISIQTGLHAAANALRRVSSALDSIAEAETDGNPQERAEVTITIEPYRIAR